MQWPHVGDVWLSSSDREEACGSGHRDGGRRVTLGRQAASCTVGRNGFRFYSMSNLMRFS